jgi:AcrR family transcriptional regulator
MMNDLSLETKSKIMDAARVLFALQGFEGTSIREIASQADVNVASVNYHFTNKEKLFSEILRSGYLECSQTMRNYFNLESPQLEDLLVYMFNYFSVKSHDLLTYFKMMMSGKHSHHMTAYGTEDEMLGPPGGKVIADCIQKELKKSLGPNELAWAVRTLFTHVTHTSILYQCCFHENKIPFTELADLELGIRRLTRLVLQDLSKA